MADPIKLPKLPERSRRKHRAKPRIRLTLGQWYAHAPNKSKAAMLMLVPAIRFVQRLNAQRALEAKHG